MDLAQVQQLVEQMAGRLDYAWTFLLLSMRYMVFFMLVPGIGGGMMGMAIRYPATLVLALVSFSPTTLAAVPQDMVVMMAQMVCEVCLGAAVAMVPLMVISGAQVAGHVASGTMGLNGAQLFDPTSQGPLADLSRIYSDIAVLVFLLIGGHYVAISELSGISSTIKPGTFILSDTGIGALIDHSARIFQVGCLIAAPVIVALLLTNFVMGIISKAIPTLNIFVVSFPLTIAVGFAISILALPEVGVLLQREISEIPRILARLL
ncbi:MAG: flagellar biosynthetic protein FliR [Pseudomonadota bacterium]